MEQTLSASILGSLACASTGFGWCWLRLIQMAFKTYVAGANGSTTNLLATVNNAGFSGLTYTYDDMGNIKTIKEGSKTETYTYDSLGQLTRVDSVWENKSIAYAYDNRGNILSKKEYAYTTDTLGTVTKTVNYAYGNTGWKDLLTNYNGEKNADGTPKTYTYDAVGNPLTYRNGMTLTWANGRQLATLTKSGATSSYSYDINGNRTKKVAGGATTEYYLNEGTIVAEKKGSNIIRYLFDENGGRFGFEYNGARYYYAFNGQGDVVSISNALSNEVARYTYDSWGKLLSVKDYSGNDKSGDASFVGNINPIRYKGYYYDTESGLYYLNSRYYDPETGRFLNADGLLGANGDILSYNQFAYCSNTPIMGYDPTGCCMTLWMQGIQGPCPGLDSPLCADNKIDYTLPNPNKSTSKGIPTPQDLILETGKNTISTAVDAAITTVVSKLPTREFIDDAAHVSLSNSAANVRISAYKTNLGNQALKGVAKAGVTTVALYVVDMGLDVYHYGWGTNDCYKAWTVTTASTAACFTIGAACSLIPGPGWAAAIITITAGTVIGVSSNYIKQQWIGY